MKFNFKWAAGRQATGPLQKDEDNTIFGFIFAHLEVFLLIGMGFMIYALFNTFTQFVADHALFIHEPDRWSFARTLIFGLMGVEVLLALATSYFRRRSEWAKSILVTLVSFIITYYNHETIAEIFRTLPAASEAVCLKLMLTNWLIFGLGEIVSLLMNSKGRALDPPPTARPAQDAPPAGCPICSESCKVKAWAWAQTRQPRGR
ncbi:MAG: hypothetical protein HC880_00225 [Bacteroidia bacterium]|nr:hypothetical protein [Bacteroidia bacterium]